MLQLRRTVIGQQDGYRDRRHDRGSVRVCTLERGDLIATGTPGGVGVSSGRLLQPGQRVRVEIEAIGAIENPVVAEPSPELSGLNTSTVGMLGAMATKACRSRSSDTSELMDNVRVDELWVCPLTPIAIATVTQFIGLGRNLVATWHTLARRTSKISQKPL
jgi:hypothetical protein